MICRTSASDADRALAAILIAAGGYVPEVSAETLCA